MYKDLMEMIQVQTKLFKSCLSINLTYTKLDFCVLSKSIGKLKTMDMQLCDGLKILEKTGSELSQVQGKAPETITVKLQSLLERNPEYLTTCKIVGLEGSDWIKYGLEY